MEANWYWLAQLLLKVGTPAAVWLLVGPTRQKKKSSADFASRAHKGARGPRTFNWREVSFVAKGKGTAILTEALGMRAPAKEPPAPSRAFGTAAAYKGALANSIGPRIVH